MSDYLGVSGADVFRDSRDGGAPGRTYSGAVAIDVVPASGHWDDFSTLMVPRRPGASGCICMSYRNSSLNMPARIDHMQSLCASKPGPGVLAYVDGTVAAWCSVAPKSTYRALVNSRTIPHVDDDGVWSVTCFVVGVGFRRRGLMHDLLDGAVAHAQESRAPALEGYPVDTGDGRVDQSSGYVGTLKLFESHGFLQLCPTTGQRGGKPRWVVRRDLP